MAITVDLPLNTPFSIIDLPDIIDFIATEASVTLDSSTQFSGTGVYTSASSTGVGTYIATGSGFATTTVGGEIFVSAGIIDTIVFSSAQGDMTFSMVDIDMAVFTPIVIDDIQGTNLFG